MTDGPRNADLCSETDVEWGRTCRGWWDGGQHNPQLAPEYGGRRIPSPHSGGALEALAIEWGPGCTFVSVFLGSMPPDCLATICLDNSIPSNSILLSFWKFAKLSRTALSQSWTIFARRHWIELSAVSNRQADHTVRKFTWWRYAMAWLCKISFIQFPFIGLNFSAHRAFNSIISVTFSCWLIGFTWKIHFHICI